MIPDLNAEWLETDGQGGFASGTVSGIRSRRYHGLLLVATEPPEGRFLMVAGLEVFLEVNGQRLGLAPQRYWPDVIAPVPPDLTEFSADPWPSWKWRVAAEIQVEHELFIHRASRRPYLLWKLTQNHPDARLLIRPFLAGRDYHSTHHENGAFKFASTVFDQTVRWQPYESLPTIDCTTNGSFLAEPLWYRNFRYSEEQARGLDFLEDLAVPGLFSFSLQNGPAVIVFGANGESCPTDAINAFEAAAKEERARRKQFASTVCRSADAYIVSGRRGTTILAGYPWFTDWGRDTFISMRGLCLSTGRLEEARSILTNWAGQVSQGMLPNRFPDDGQAPEFNSVDASLWFIVAVHDFLQTAERTNFELSPEIREQLWTAVGNILDDYTQGTRYCIQMDPADGLLRAGEPGMQLTWMDARVGDHEITPRIGKPVEIQALWINALWIAREKHSRFRSAFEVAFASFLPRFWDESSEYLFDVIDCDHQPGRNDSSLRPNQVFALGGLPFPLVDLDHSRRALVKIESKLLTSVGLRSLSPDDSRYVPHYQGQVAQRDGAYHQGTVWPFLIAAFVEAWLRVHGNTAETRTEATRRFLFPLADAMNHYGINHLAEIADGDPPHTLRGCPFQAWSLGEFIRLENDILQFTT